MWPSHIHKYEMLKQMPKFYSKSKMSKINWDGAEEPTINNYPVILICLKVYEIFLYSQNCFHRNDYSEYGTMLEIRDVQYFPDGRSLVDTVGARRFKVKSKGHMNGYETAKVEFIADSTVTEVDKPGNCLLYLS